MIKICGLITLTTTISSTRHRADPRMITDTPTSPEPRVRPATRPDANRIIRREVVSTLFPSASFFHRPGRPHGAGAVAFTRVITEPAGSRLPGVDGKTVASTRW